MFFIKSKELPISYLSTNLDNSGSKLSHTVFIRNIACSFEFLERKEAACNFDLNNKYLSTVLGISITYDKLSGGHQI